MYIIQGDPISAKLRSAPFLRWSLVVLCGFLFLCLDLFRGKFLINLSFNGQAWLLPRTGTLPVDRPNTINLLQAALANPKWSSTLAYNLLYLLMTTLLIYLIFLKRDYTRFTLFFCIGLNGLGVLLIIVGNVLGFSGQAYAAADNFKELLASPFTAMFLIAAFSLHQRLPESN